MVENHHTARRRPPLFSPVGYTVRFPAPQTHYAEVEALLPTGGAPSLDTFLPVWTPGSYLVREFARNIEGVTAANPSGTGLTVTATRKNRWRIETGGASDVLLRYRVYCHEMSVRTNWVEEGFALLNGAPTFITLVEDVRRPCEVRLELPAAWKTTMTGMSEAPGGAPHHYLAPDYDTLVDSPILAGNPAVYRFEVDGIPHFLVNEGEGGVFDGKRAAADLEKIVRTYRGLWGSLPYRKYVFLNLITETNGGLEHNNSVCMMASRWATSTRPSYLGWLDLASHEFFHVWNVKRLRPAELGPFDYENENPTHSLWIAEGFTDYYSFLTMRRAGLNSAAEYLGTGDSVSRSLSEKINELQTAPGRLVQSAEMASFHAWIKHYRPHENSGNISISYYTKGAIVGWLLDARIRRMTNGAKSLDDLMRLAFSRYSGERGYTPAEFRAAAAEVAGGSLDDFFRHAVDSTEELDYKDALDWFGLGFRNNPVSTRATLGVETRIDNGRLLVRTILRSSPAWQSGLNVDDEIIGIGDYRVRADQLSKRLENYCPGDAVTLQIARRERLMQVELTLSAEASAWQLEVLPTATVEQKAHLATWLVQLSA